MVSGETKQFSFKTVDNLHNTLLRLLFTELVFILTYYSGNHPLKVFIVIIMIQLSKRKFLTQCFMF